MWEYRYDIKSDMSRFHGIRDYRTVSANDFVALALRLGMYEGCMTEKVREEQRKREEMEESWARQAEQRATAFAGTRDALESNQLFAGLGEFKTVPAD